MKYTSRADLLIAAGESIKMQEKAGVNEPAVKYKGEITACDELSYTKPQLCEYEFPLAVVEGKPVFVGDELYCHNGTKGKVIEYKPDEYGGPCLKFEPFAVSYVTSCTWNPPKPETVMVELLREDAKRLSNYLITIDGIKIGESCRKALEKE